MSAPGCLGYFTKVIVSYPSPTAKISRSRFGSMSVPSICDKTKRCALDFHTPAMSVSAGVVGSCAQADRNTATAIPMIRLTLKLFEKTLLQLNSVDSCWPLLAFWNDRPARVYY